MKANVTCVKKVVVREVDPKKIPNGSYDGIWGGYVVNVTIKGVDYELATDVGIRTPRAACTVHVSDGVITVT